MPQFGGGEKSPYCNSGGGNGRARCPLGLKQFEGIGLDGQRPALTREFRDLLDLAKTILQIRVGTGRTSSR